MTLTYIFNNLPVLLGKCVASVFTCPIGFPQTFVSLKPTFLIPLTHIVSASQSLFITVNKNMVICHNMLMPNLLGVKVLFVQTI